MTTQAQSVAIESSQINSSGVLGISGGGTNSTATPTNGGVGYGTGTAHAYTVVGTSGYYLQSNGAAAPTWSAVTVTPSVPSGSVFLLYQASAPSGWTQVTTLNDYALRVTSSTGGGTGGTTAFSTVFANQTPTINVSGLSAGATTLSTAQIPSHTHTSPKAYGCGGCNFSYGSTLNGTVTTGAAGGGGSHTHSISGSASSSAITLNVQYANVIICSKN